MDKEELNEVESEENAYLDIEASSKRTSYKTRIHIYLQPEVKPIIMSHKEPTEKVSYFINRCIRFTCDYIDNNSGKNIETLKLRLSMILNYLNSLPENLSSNTEIRILQRDILECDKICSDILTALNP